MLHIYRRPWIWALFVLGSAQITWAGPLEDRLLADAVDGQWDQHTLLRAALISSGVANQQALTRLEQRYASIVKQVTGESWKTLPSGTRARQLLLWLHRHVLIGGYHQDCSSLAQAFDTGQFNCVNSAILYHSLAQEIGLKTQLVALPKHIYIELQTAGSLQRIETTTSGGVFPASTADELTQTNRLGPRRMLSEVQAVSLLYYNFGATSFRQKDYAASVKANLTAVRLDPQHAEARANLIASINNWAVLLSKQQRYHQAGTLLETGLALAPGEASLKANLRHLQQSRQSGNSSNRPAGFVSADDHNP